MVALYAQQAGDLLRYAFSICKNPDLAEETVQEAYFRYYVARIREDIGEVGRPWLFRVARNYVLDRLKEQAFRNKVSIDDIPELAEPARNPEAAYECSEIQYQAYRLLAPRELACFQLRIAGFRHREIAKLMGIECGTVGAMLTRGLKKIRKLGSA